MNVLTCVVEKCGVQFQTEIALSPNANFICKNHPVSVQKKAVRFQEHAFDSTLNPGGGDKKESEEYDRDWGMSGDPMAVSEKCEHGVYDPNEDRRYCTICTPATLTGKLREAKKTKNGRIAAFKDLSEQSTQAAALILFYHTVPEHLQPAWFTNKELGFKTAAKRILNPQLKKNSNYGRDQFGDGIE